MIFKRLRFTCLFFLALLLGVTLPCVSSDGDEISGGLLVPHEKEEVADEKIICISDFHLTDTKSHDNGYASIEKNIPKLVEFLDKVAADKEVTGLVICGDMLDEWKCPNVVGPAEPPFNKVEERFLDIASSKYNERVINKLKEIVEREKIKVTYTPGNHDNLCTKEVIQKIIPGINFEDIYELCNGQIVIEHGHRVDIFNANNTVSYDGHNLPLGYFITRQHTSLSVRDGLMVGSEAELDGDPVVPAIYKRLKAGKKDENIVGKGIIDYPMFIYDGACLLYNRDSKAYMMENYRGVGEKVTRDTVKGKYNFTDDKWDEIKDADVVCGWWDSYWSGVNLDIFYKLAVMQYFENDNLKQEEIPKVVVWGHTHTAMGYKHKGTGSLYLNDGTWVDNKKGGCNYAEIVVCHDKIIGSVFEYKGKDAVPREIFSDTVKR